MLQSKAALVTTLLALLAAAPSLAQDTERELPPGFALIGSTTENSWLSMRCDGTPPYREVACSFEQVSVSSNSEAEVQKKLAASRVELTKAADELTFPKVRARLCSSLGKDKHQLTSQARSTPPDVQAVESARFADRERACATCSHMECLVALMMKSEEENLRTCRISVNTFSFTFKRTSPTRWAHTGTQGMCNNSFIVTLERDKEHDSLWTFTQLRVPGDVESPLCAGQKESQSKFDWRVGSTMDLSKSCKSGRFQVSVF